jgi:hypothetical protein
MGNSGRWKIDQGGGDFVLGDEVKDGEEQERLVRGAMVGQGRSTVTVPVRPKDGWVCPNNLEGYVQEIVADGHIAFNSLSGLLSQPCTHSKFKP